MAATCSMEDGQSSGYLFLDEFFLQDFMDLKTFLKNTFHKDLHEVDLCVKGWNWGDVTFRGSLLSFNVDSKPAFEVPLKEVSQVSFNV